MFNQDYFTNEAFYNILNNQSLMLTDPYESPSMTTPYLDSSSVDTPFIDHGLEGTPSFENLLDFCNQYPFAEYPNPDVCVDGYLSRSNGYDQVPTFNGDPNALLLDKSKSNPFYLLDNSLFPPLMGDFIKQEPVSFPNSIAMPSEPIQQEQKEIKLKITNKKSVVDTKSKKPMKAKKTAKPVKLYECHICGHQSKRQYNLTTHIKTHNKNRFKEFECTVCLKRFDRRHDRDRHLETVHNKDKAHNCHECNVRFTRKDAFDRHLIQKHNCNPLTL